MLLELLSSHICAIWTEVNSTGFAVVEAEINVEISIALVAVHSFCPWIRIVGQNEHLMTCITVRKTWLPSLSLANIFLESHEVVVLMMTHWRSMMLLNYSDEATSLMMIPMVSSIGTHR